MMTGYMETMAIRVGNKTKQEAIYMSARVMMMLMLVAYLTLQTIEKTTTT